MFIIADIEWVENNMNKKSPTQLSAVRVDENWEIVDDFSTRIKPLDSTFYDWKHIAYTGGDPSDFIKAPHCYKVLKSFNEWVGDDTLCWWFKPSAEMHALMNKIVLKAVPPKQPIILSEYMPTFFEGNGIYYGSAYKIAAERNISGPFKEHDSWDDVMAILHLFRGVNFPQEALSTPPLKIQCKAEKFAIVEFEYQYDVKAKLLHKKGCELLPTDTEIYGFETLKTPMRKRYKPCSCVRSELNQAYRERVISTIERTAYNFVYAEKSNVFHRCDCGLLHNARNILGTHKYETIISKRLRPCMVCNPSPEDQFRPVAYKHKVRNMVAKQGLKKSELTAIARLEQAQKERFEKMSSCNLNEKEKQDLLTLTQPGFAFFVAKGYLNFHTRSCSRLAGLSEIRGFGTFAHATNAGYTPCKYCKPSKKQDILKSIPIGNMVREDETVTDLQELCSEYGYVHSFYGGIFEVTTSVGKWKIHTDMRPVTMEHINLARNPICERYHMQHRIFLSMLDALKYIYKHDSKLMGFSTSQNESGVYSEI